MIIVDEVYKRYQTDHGVGKWVLKGATFTIPPKVNVGLVGRNGAGKSTLLRLIGGIDKPTRGKVERHCRVSWPMGFGGGLQGVLTAAEQQLVKTAIPEQGRDLLKQVRTQLIELARSQMEAMVEATTGVKVVSLHHDISTTSGEEVLIFTFAESPQFRESKR